MLRLFKESLTRNITDLDGRWYYCADESGLAQWQSGLPACKKPIMIPGCWNNENGMLQFEGDVWLETEFYTTEENIRLVFGAVNNECDVYVDGCHWGYHWGPFAEFSFTKKLSPGMHRLVVRTNNLHNEVDTIPLSNVDWFHYGGIIRSVELHQFRTACVDSVKLAYTLDGNNALLRANISLQAFTAVSAPVKLLLDGVVLAQQEVTLEDSGSITLQAELKDVALWSPHSPALYTFTVEFADDSLRERTGFRTIEIKNSKFLLNGDPIFFKGVNRHEEHPEWGFAVPAKLAKKDIDIIKDMGCNFIRGSHYPNAKSTLDYLDEIGLLFWEEIPMWGFREEHLANQTVRTRGVYLHSNMVQRDYNHPCIVVWGLNNEVDTATEAAREVAKLFRDTIQALDTSRLITFASNRGHTDLCYEYADFVSVNNYTAWYSKDGTELSDWQAYIDKLIDYMNQTGNSHKPIVISEFGAGAIYGVRELEEGLYWTENYQKEYLEYTLDLFLHHPCIQGAIIWQFCDIRSGTKSRESGIRRLLSRPRSFNNKGLVNEFRRPKLAYYTVKNIYSSME